MKAGDKVSFGRVALWGILGLAGLCLALAGISALANRGLPQHSAVIDRLSPADKARAAEAFHLRHELGDAVIPGWSQADLPQILYNEQYVFLVGYAGQPPDGWHQVPSGEPYGGAWETVPGDTFQGQPYFRLRLPNADTTPQSFTVRVGDRWVPSLMARDWFGISLAEQFREGLPGPLKPVFPYSFVVDQFLGGSDQYLAAMLHEAAHSYQGMKAPTKLAAAEINSGVLDERYPWDDARLSASWNAELDVLRDSMRAKTDEEARSLARKFLSLRKARRLAGNLPADLVDFERTREWEEGFAKYAEMSIYRQAAQTPGYAPVPEMKLDAKFHSYKGFAQRWNNEVNQISLIGRQQSDEEVRLYYSGWAQAALLDRLKPGWKDQLFADGVWLEDLLREAVQ